MNKLLTIPFRVLTVIILLFQVSAALAMSDSISYDLSHYTSENGLPQNSVKSIARDTHGFIWMTTEGGLVRFDGQHFKIFNKQTLSIASSRMRYLVRGMKTGSLYAVTDLRRLIRIRDADATLLPAYVKASSSFTIAADSTVSAFHVLAPNLYQTAISQEVPHQLSVTAELSFLISGDTIRLYDKKKEQWKTAFPHDNNWLFFILGKQLFYLNNDGSVTQVRKGSHRTFWLNGDIRQNPAYTRERPRLYWNATSGEVFLYLNQCFYMLEHQRAGQPAARLLLSGFDAVRNNISSVYYDPDNGHLFLGSLTKGLFIARRKAFITLTTAGVDETYYAQLAYGENVVLTYKGRILGTEKPAGYLPLVDRYNDNYSMLTDSAGNIWQKKLKSVYQLSPGGDRLLNKYTLPGQVSGLFLGLNHRLWIGTEKNGLYFLNPGEEKPRQFMPFRETLSFFAQENENTLWAGTKSGLYRIALKEKKADTIEGLDALHIRSIHITGPREIWVTTEGGGFYLYKDGLLTNFPLDRNGYLAEAHCILEDDNGYFWISTNRGLFQVSKAALLDFADKKREELFYMYYGKEAGFNTNEFNGGCQPCGIKLESGYFSFPSLNGLVWFRPADMQAELPGNGIYIDEVEVDDVLFAANDTTRVPSRFNRVRVRFTSPYFGNAYNLSFKYKLDGPDRQGQWLESAGDRAISFSSMSSGTYTLTIRKQSGFGTSDYTEKQLVIIVPPLFYETWWFKASVVLAAILAILFYIRFRLNTIKRKNDELENRIAERTLKLKQTIFAHQASEDRLQRQNYLQQRLLASITHDIKSPLQYLAMSAKNMHENLPEENGSMRNDLETIHRSAHRLFHFTENLVQYMKANMAGNRLNNEQLCLSDLIDEKIELFSDLAASKGNSIENTVDPDILIRTNAQLLGIIIHNLLDNSVKFTRSGYIRFSARSSDSQLRLALEDSGQGMDVELMAWCNHIDPREATRGTSPFPIGLGLSIVLELLSMIDGKLSVSGKPRGGTRIELTL